MNASETSVGIDSPMEDGETVSQPLNDWNDLGGAGQKVWEETHRQRWGVPMFNLIQTRCGSRVTSAGTSFKPNGQSQQDRLERPLRHIPKNRSVAQTVANVPKYDGKNSLTDFLRALEVKFPSALWTDSDKRDILVNHLEGIALSIYKGLPHAVREGTYDEIVSALKMARRNPCERLKNVREWEQLSKRPSESVAEFCCRMEDLSRRIHPSSEMDFIRGSKLYSCLQHWQNSYHMLAALDVPDGNIYTEVKRVAMRLEKLQ
ncbi:hypothetical protein OSTOST_24018, partial [Ostertagia ostertagi]